MPGHHHGQEIWLEAWLPKDDVCCPVALIAYGWLEERPDMSEVEEVMLASGYAQNRQAARGQIEAIPRLAEGE